MRRVPLALALVALFAALAVPAGLFQFRASTGHWSITSAFLHFTMRRSVATWSAGIRVPPVEPGQVELGAGHYESGCRPCHGAPGAPRPAYLDAMLPPPPDLAPEMDQWDAEDLFYVVKHGIKFTGMPGWPAQERDDEVWAMVAFLQALPGLDAGAYAELVHGPPAPADVPEAARPCVRCHGADGLGRGAFPRLAGQSPRYFVASMRAYRHGARPSAVMETAVDLVDEAAIDALARWFAELPPGPGWPPPPGADLARGEAIAKGEVPRVPGCVHCHGPSDRPRNPAYPLLAGQDPRFLHQQLKLFREGKRGGSAHARLMEVVAGHALDEAHARDVIAWYASLGPEVTADR